MEKERIYQIFIDWKARPTRATDPKDVDEFCKTHEIEKSDLAEFISRADYSDRLTTAALNWARGKVPELLHTAFNTAKLSGDVAAIERFISIAHALKDKKGQSGQGNQYNFFNIDNDKLKQIAARTIGTELLPSGSSTSEVA